MAIDFLRISIDDSAPLHSDMLVVDRFSNQIVYGSVIGYDTLLKNIAKSMKNKSLRSHVTRYGAFMIPAGCEIEREKKSGDDFAQMIFKKKDEVDTSDNKEVLRAYILYRTEEELNELFYDKIYANMSVPILKEWVPFIMRILLQRRKINNLVAYYAGDTAPFQGVVLNVSQEELLEIINVGLSENIINISNVNNASEIMGEVMGLDSYLGAFGDVLADKIQNAFVPKFNPHTDEYSEYVNNYDDSCHYNGIEIYEAQKAVIQAVYNNMKKNKTTFVIGEMGVGKTLLGAGMSYVHYGQKSGSSSIIMCPGHLVYIWKRELEALVPNAKAYIVENISELMALEEKIKDKTKKESTYIILSKESAKFSYEKRPAVNWSRSKGCFTCPDCGNKLFKYVYVGKGRDRVKIKEYLTKEDFKQEYAYNVVCENMLEVTEKNSTDKKKVKCGNKLWTPLNRFDENNPWIKLGSGGWIMKNHFDSIHDDYYSRRDKLNKKEQEFLLRLVEQNSLIKNGGELKSSSNGVRKYSIAKYVRERLKGHIDYFIADELK